MKNSKGQALVEFVIILPILLLIIISMFDLGNIITQKYNLENEMDTISDLYKSKKYSEIKSYISVKQIKVNYEKKDGFTTITLSNDVYIISPLLTVVLGKKYEISSSKSFFEESNE